MNSTQKALASIFDEWAERYYGNCDSCDTKIFDETGRPNENYGKECAETFIQIMNDLDLNLFEDNAYE